MKVSVITPTFNRAHSLPTCLKSISSQEPAPWEHIIVDNLSTDSTQELVEAYKAKARYKVVYSRQKDTGIYQAMNNGLVLATGEAIHILNDDDQFAARDSLQILSACLDRFGSDLVYGDVLVCNSQTGAIKIRHHNQVNRLTLAHKTINQQSTLYRKELFVRVGKFDEAFKIAGDYEWLLRAFLKYKTKATYLRHPVARFSEGGLSSGESSAKRFTEERNHAVQTWFTEKELHLARFYRKYLRKIPFGTFLLGKFVPIQFDITSVRYLKGRFVTDWASALGF